MTPDALVSAMAGLPSSSPQDLTSIYQEASPFLCDEPEVNAAVLEFFSRIEGNIALAQKISEVRVKWPYMIAVNIRPFNPASVRSYGHTNGVWGVAALDWPGLDHPVIATTSVDRSARVWDPCDSGRELACFDGHTNAVLGVTALELPDLDHPVIVTVSGATARVRDPRDPRRELADLPLFGEGYSVITLNPTTLAGTSSRGFLVFDLRNELFRRNSEASRVLCTPVARVRGGLCARSARRTAAA